MKDSPQNVSPQVQIQDFLLDRPMTRPGRALKASAVLVNMTEDSLRISIRLKVPDSVRLKKSSPRVGLCLKPKEQETLEWTLIPEQPLRDSLILEAFQGEDLLVQSILPFRILPRMEGVKEKEIPEPQPASSPLLIGAHHCPLWENDKPRMWSQIRKHPERIPALGFYGQENPEVSDWETLWATEHGLDFFLYCWYRTSQGGPVTTQFSSAIDPALFHSRYVNRIRFSIMWENQSRGTSGVSNLQDLLQNLLPFWIENYFKHPSYLKVDNKPLLFIYRSEFLVDDLSGVENVAKAFDLMRQACRDQGFDGLTILGEYRGLDEKHLRLMKSLGLDYAFAYCWYVPDNPSPQKAIETQMQYIRKTQEMGILPQVVTVSQGWTGWGDEGSIWRIPPLEYESLLGQAKDFISSLPESELGHQILLLDNWNEWGEGHFIAPYVDEGFGYLDAVRKVLTNAPLEHADVLPEDVGLGPYDIAYRKTLEEGRSLRNRLSEKALKAGGSEKGLIAWWTFDEKDDDPVALDYSGHRLGGRVEKSRRVPGRDNKALACEGGCVVVDYAPELNTGEAMTLSCWVKTDVANQEDKWIVNRVYHDGASGYRLGFYQGRPCFGLPLTGWSHHLNGSKALPLGQWVHLAATFDGQIMRLFMDGEEVGSMSRPGPINPNDFHLCLGSYEKDHRAYFSGLLDEVKLYSRALSREEVAKSCTSSSGL